MKKCSFCGEESETLARVAINDVKELRICPNMGDCALRCRGFHASLLKANRDGLKDHFAKLAWRKTALDLYRAVRQSERVKPGTKAWRTAMVRLDIAMNKAVLANTPGQGPRKE